MRCRNSRNGPGSRQSAVSSQKSEFSTKRVKSGTGPKRSEMKRERIILSIDICGCKSLFGLPLGYSLGWTIFRHNTCS